ncbi:MAG: prepilin-type N-terminal cleavage/methylation domain-containing protein [Planctomycetes bacterium]|nr:prepilin-type N-terminal cleavage/methylation domain-containing protein [Armatimonadota bacterium]MBM4073168.1 prepilin-type N-terminal cleavage/methylation domain-containing protein [Planctomycetota bacterium]
MTTRPPTARGMSLIELLVSLTVLALLGTALAQIYQTAQTAFLSGGGRIALQQRARETLRRLTPYVSCAVPAAEGAEAVTAPPVTPSPTPNTVLEYTSPMDLLGGAPVDPRAPVSRKYRICFAEDPRYPTVTGTKPKIWLAQIGTEIPSDNAAIIGKRVLADQIDGFKVIRPTVNSVEITVTKNGTVKTARFQDRTISVSLKTSVQIPYYATRP